MSGSLLLLAPILLAAFVVDVIAWSYRPPPAWCDFDDVAGFGNYDPHLGFKLKGVEGHICFDLIGRPGDVYRLFNVDGVLDVTALLIPGVHVHAGHNTTYFGKFTFTDSRADIVINVTTTALSIGSGAKEALVAWPRRVRRKILFRDPAQNLTLVHEKRKIMDIKFNGTEFRVTRHTRKYRRYKGADKESVHYLGVYATRGPASVYSGLIGELMGKSGVFHNETHEIDFRNRTVEVIDHSILDMLHHKYQRCWFVPKTEDLLQFPLAHYKLN